MNALLGEVVYETPPNSGSLNHFLLKWRVKRSIDRHEIYIGLSMRPDGYAGAEGSPTNYMNFRLVAATSLRDSLDECIAVARQHLDSSASPGAE